MLTRRIAESLRRQGGSHPVDAGVVVSDDPGPHVAPIAAVPGVRLLVRPGPDDDATFHDAGVVGATAVGLVDRKNVTNIHRALRVQELDPEVRLVVRLFNVALGRRIRALLPRATVLSVSHIAAPSFITAAIGRAVRQHVRTAGRTFVIAGRHEVPNARVVCGLAAHSVVRFRGDPVLLPDDEACGVTSSPSPTPRAASATASASRARPGAGRRRPPAHPAARRAHPPPGAGGAGPVHPARDRGRRLPAARRAPDR